jgi:S-adenosyl-L-methionine hydrolase (adenosine-forming)
MRGVALDICPGATLTDITHDIAPQDVFGGALELAAACKYFPQGTVFLCVVDPGVGSSRRGIAADAGGHRFVAPDNGLLTQVFKQSAPMRVVELTERKYALPTVSRTFEGRDRFAPAAAWLANGIDLSALGRPVTDWQVVDVPEPKDGDGQLSGVVLRVDRFGNLITNIDRERLVSVASSRPIQIAIAGQPVTKFVATYAEAEPESLCALFGSTDHLEIAVVGGSAAERLALTRGAAVVVRFDAFP